MKYVTRPAPPPPGASSTEVQQQSISSQMAKPKPPRPPPPRAPPSSDNNSKSSVRDQPMKIFSNLFGGKKAKSNNSNNATSQINPMEMRLPPPRLPPAPSTALINRQSIQSTPVYNSDVQLINFNDSPPASPVGFIKKSNTGGSDSVSIDSFCSTNSSPHNFNSGTQSQAERYDDILIEL